MHNDFTVHCIPWHAGALLLQEVRVAANGMARQAPTKISTDRLDTRCRHALALSKNGKPIGCARITPDGRIERVVTLQHEHRAQIEAALIEVLKDYSEQIE